MYVLMLVLPYILDGLADEFVVPHDANRSPANHVMDLFPDVIMAINEWLHWYDIYKYVDILTYAHTCIYVQIQAYKYIVCNAQVSRM
jgi:hypothetical protein